MLIYSKNDFVVRFYDQLACQNTENQPAEYSLPPGNAWKITSNHIYINGAGAQRLCIGSYSQDAQGKTVIPPLALHDIKSSSGEPRSGSSMADVFDKIYLVLRYRAWRS